MVETPELLSAVQKGDVALKARPQGLTRFESVRRATPAMSETRLTRVYIGWSSVSCGAATITPVNVTINRKTTRICFMGFLPGETCMECITSLAQSDVRPLGHEGMVVTSSPAIRTHWSRLDISNHKKLTNILTLALLNSTPELSPKCHFFVFIRCR